MYTKHLEFLQMHTAPVWRQSVFPVAWVLRSQWQCASVCSEPFPDSRSARRIEHSLAATAPTHQKTKEKLG